MSDQVQVGLAHLPPEILLRLLRAFLDPQSIARLAQTSTLLYHLAKSDLVWRDIVLDLVQRHGVTPRARLGRLARSSPAPAPSPATTWYDQARFLLPHARHLGYFASSLPFSSRIVRASIVVPERVRSDPAAYAEGPPELAIHLAQLRPFNAYSLTSPPPLAILPFGAALEITLDSYSISRVRNPAHPDAELSIDVLSPRYDWSAAMVDITRAEGALLSRPYAPSSNEARFATGLDSPSPSDAARDRLRLGLVVEPTTQVVHAGSQAGYRPAPINELSREALLALFSGRLPRRAWPTYDLVGLDLVSPEPDEFDHRARGPRKIRRGANGAFRGLEDWLLARGDERELARIVEHAAGKGLDAREDPTSVPGDDEAYVTGFRLKARRSQATGPSRPTTTVPSAPTPPPTHEARLRRRGVGRDGGMAVLWNGQEDDPDDAPPVTILRVGDQDDGGVVMHLDEDTRDRLPTRPVSAAPARDASASPDTLADAVDAAGETFFPIKAPAGQVAWDDDSAVDANGAIKSTSLEGMWVGTYGSHGLEFVHLSTSFSTSSPPSQFPTPPSEPDLGAPTATGPDETYNRILTATKVTGDSNVPAGETTWIAFLDELPRCPTLGDILDGPTPSISSDKWNLMNQVDPSTTSGRFSRSEWAEGTTKGVGQIALSGFHQPGWTAASVRFIRSRTTLRRYRTTGHVSRVGSSRDAVDDVSDDPFEADRIEASMTVAREGADPDEVEEKEVETVDEIHLRWAELSKIAVFKRVRI
ncbi:hypothetical protein JCM10212_003438 [Sporobolomyces blumeae]